LDEVAFCRPDRLVRAGREKLLDRQSARRETLLKVILQKGLERWSIGRDPIGIPIVAKNACSSSIMA
jgi:hypothetical protein